MRPQPSTLVTVTAAVMSLVLVAGCEAKVHGDPGLGQHPGPQVVSIAQLAGMFPMANPAAVTPDAAFRGADGRTQQATVDAAKAGAQLSTMVLDRATGRTLAGNGASLPIASVAKLFIADEVLLQDATGQAPLAPDDRQALDVMLRSSDDGAANNFWARGGGSAIISRVSARYGLTSTTPPYDGNWWNVMSTPADLVRYYDMLLDGTGGLPLDRASVIVDNLAQSTPQGIDGYPQRFGIPDGLPGEPVAVKQGWMCCWNGGNWMHLSTGVIGANRRYVMVIGSLQPSDDATARNTLTQAVKIIFPGGRID